MQSEQQCTYKTSSTVLILRLIGLTTTMMSQDLIMLNQLPSLMSAVSKGTIRHIKGQSITGCPILIDETWDLRNSQYSDSNGPITYYS